MKKGFSGKRCENNAWFRHSSHDLLDKIAKRPRSPRRLIKICVYPVFNRRLGDLGLLAILARI
jgi:hypothetical protein